MICGLADTFDGHLVLKTVLFRVKCHGLQPSPLDESKLAAFYTFFYQIKHANL